MVRTWWARSAVACHGVSEGPSPAPCLLQLRAQVDAAWPGRLKTSDGIMGDLAHRRRKSDHNEGNAIDLTHSPRQGLDVGLLAEAFRRQMASSPTGRISYLIFNARISSPIEGWTWRPYHGMNPHRTHLHISIVAAQRHNVRPWKLT